MFIFFNQDLVATLENLPTEVIYIIINQLTQLSYRDRARVACVSKACRDIADSEVGYRAQYIRDFGYPVARSLLKVDRYPIRVFSTSLGSTRNQFPDLVYHTCDGSGLEPP